MILRGIGHIATIQKQQMLFELWIQVIQVGW